MRKWVIDKRGTTSVFLAIILASMIGLTYMYIQGAIRVAAVSYGDSILNLSSRSVLSEYDVKLKEDYGLFAFYGDRQMVENKVLYYTNYTLEGNSHVFIDRLNVDLSQGTMLDVNTFYQAVIDYSKYCLARGILKEVIGNEGQGQPLPGEEPGRTLRRAQIINDLPSTALGDNGGTFEAIKDGFKNIDEVFKTGSENFLFNRYVMDKFKNGQDNKGGRETFFQYEAEYILCGNYNDWENMKEFRRNLVLIRNVQNLIFIYADPVKRGQLVAAASVVSPGVTAIIAQAVLAEVWALAESENDVRLLEAGKVVPIIKTSETWAIDIESVIGGTTGEGYIDTGSTSGLSYTGYVEICLFFMDKPTKGARTMDLIQINMIANYNKGFRIRDYNCGFDLKAKIKGREYEYYHQY